MNSLLGPTTQSSFIQPLGEHGPDPNLTASFSYLPSYYHSTIDSPHLNSAGYFWSHTDGAAADDAVSDESSSHSTQSSSYIGDNLHPDVFTNINSRAYEIEDNDSDNANPTIIAVAEAWNLHGATAASEPELEVGRDRSSSSASSSETAAPPRSPAIAQHHSTSTVRRKRAPRHIETIESGVLCVRFFPNDAEPTVYKVPLGSTNSPDSTKVTVIEGKLTLTKGTIRTLRGTGYDEIKDLYDLNEEHIVVLKMASRAFQRRSSLKFSKSSSACSVSSQSRSASSSVPGSPAATPKRDHRRGSLPTSRKNTVFDDDDADYTELGLN